jgi:hypothetical protein
MYFVALCAILWIYFSLDPHFATVRPGQTRAPIGYSIGYTVTWAFLATAWPTLLALVFVVIGRAPPARRVAALAALAAVVYASITFLLVRFAPHISALQEIQAPGALAFLLVFLIQRTIGQDGRLTCVGRGRDE